MTEKDIAITLYRNIIDSMQGHTFFVQDDDGLLRRWTPPRRPQIDSKVEANDQ